MAKHLLITGGAGYIGSHQVRYLLARGIRVTILDNLSQGIRAFVPAEASFIEGGLGNGDLLDRLFSSGGFDGVIHFAGASCVGPSVKDPLFYYQNNVLATQTLVSSMIRHRIQNLVFSSSAAVYGNPLSLPLKEDHPLNPVSPYGWTKRIIEQMLFDCARAYPIRFVALRYFNAAGAIEDGTIGELHDPESHLIPLMLRAIQQKSELCIYGDKYCTRDGTCVRDYVHVMDLVDAHWLAFEYLLEGGESIAMNLGSGVGYSVREIISAAKKITELPLASRIEEPRAGDVSELVADISRAKEMLQWSPQFGLEKILASAWKWELRGDARRR